MLALPRLPSRWLTALSGIVLALVLVMGNLLAGAGQAHAAITYVASASNPADGFSLDTTLVAVTPPASMTAGDLVIMVANSREAAQSLAISQAGGQTWTSQTASTTNTTSRIFWARYTGSWSANPSISFPSAANGTTVSLHVFRPSASVNTWAIDATQINAAFSTPASPFDVSNAGITTATADALVLATWASVDNNTWSLQTSGWSNAGSAQYRNGDGSDCSQSSAYQIKAIAGATGSVVNRQASLGGDAGNTSIVAFKEIPVTTLATGSDPAAATIAPGAAATDVNQFTFTTSSGSEAISSVTVNLSAATGIGRLAITDNAGTERGFTTSPVTGSNTITVSGLSATTTTTTFKVRVTPLSHAAMPVPPGASYSVTAPVTAWAGSNTHTGSDTNTTALTIDNLSPGVATGISTTAGVSANTLAWTTSASTDFTASSGSVIYRWTGTAGSEVPVEGSTPSTGSTNGTATVACVISSAASSAQSKIDGTGGSAGCTTAALTNGQSYAYRVFQKDTSGNYDVGVSMGSATPKANQTITFGAQTITSRSYSTGGTFALNPTATASSGLAVTYSSTTTGVCTISGTTVTMVAVGTCTIAADQAGNTVYNAAPQVTRSVTIIQGTQTISFGAAPSVAVDSTGTASATATSGLAVTYGTTTPLFCSVNSSSGVVTGLLAGSCTITANQTGNTNFLAASQATQSITIAKGTQATLTVTGPSSVTYGNTGTLTSSGGSGTGTVSFASSTPLVCTVSGTTLTVVTATGTCTVSASKPADNNYNATTSANFNVTMNKASQTITFGTQTTPRNFSTGGTFAISPTATASSGLAITYTSTTTGVCTVSGTTVTMSTTGTCTIAANQAGDANYNAAAQVTQNVIINAAPPTATTSAASGISTTGATLNGTVTSNGATTTVTFDYGLTTGYGSSISATPATVAATSSSSVSAAVSGLTCGTTYHFRVKGVNSAGTTNGSDTTFSTAACTGAVVSPTVSTVSIACTSANPIPNPDGDTCTATSSSATLVANNVRTATITVILKTAAGATVSGRTVTLAQSGGTSTITTLVGTTDAFGVATFTVQNSSAEGPITYTATDTTDSLVITPTVQATFTSSLCFYDNFTGSGSPGSNWTVGKVSGSFTPTITGNRLRLTDTGGSESTWVSLNKYFPGAGNKITVEFDHLAYGGSGADGIGVIISDASVTPASGAFGGSLGYAPKSNPGSDCTVTGGCVGFAGGWMGVALDEFGNFSNPTEGRYGGTGFFPDSVSIRGSGSGMSGYRFITGTGTLATGVDGNGSATPLHRYRIVIDHSDGIHAWVSVERDTTGGGTSYTKLIGDTACTTSLTASCLDIKDPGYSQDTVPANWRLSFAGSTGGSTNTHEFDSLKVCTAQSIVTPSLHHIELNHTGQACTGSPTTITLKACADATCSVLYPDNLTATLSATPSTGTATWVSSPVTITGGTKTVTLSNSTDATVTISATATSPTAVTASSCKNGASTSCNIAVAACVLDAVETTATAAFTPINTKLAGAAFSLDVRNMYATSQTLSAVEIVDASSGTCSTYASLANTTSAGSPWTIAGSGKQTFGFNYAQSVKNARIRMTVGGVKYCSSDNFAIRPQGFVAAFTAADVALTATQNNTATPTLKAGTDVFKIKVEATVTNYTDTPKYIASSTTTTLPTMGTITPSGSGFIYSEVGNFTFGQYAVYDDHFADVDSTKAQPECTPDFSNTAVGGKFGCMFRNAAAINVGRFVPDHFDTAITAPMLCSSLFVTDAATVCPTNSNQLAYSGQPFTTTITAKSGLGNTTLDYTGSYAKTVTLGAWSALGSTTLQNPPATVSGVLTGATVANTSFTSGVASVTTNYAFKSWPATILPITATAPVVPTNIYLRASDTDSVTSLRSTNPTTTSVEGGARILSGKLLIENMYGPPGGALQTKVRQLYYTAASIWAPNTVATFSGATPALQASGNFLATNSYGITLSGLASASSIAPCKDITGVFCLTLTAPTSGSGNRSVVISGSSAITAYLPGSGTLTWGVFRAPYIYMRER